MNLIAYSDSDESDNDAPQLPKPAAKPAPKPTFQKVVDRSAPGKIKLNLPTPSQPRTEKDDIEADAPPAKKARTGGGAFSGFNAMLPAPKKPALDTTTKDTGSGIAGKRGVGKGLGVGVNLRTGAEPAFRREQKDEDYDEDGNPVGNPVKKANARGLQKEDFRAMLGLPPAKTESTVESQPQALSQKTQADSENKSEPMRRFMPMSVGQGKKKKKPMAPRPASTTAPSLGNGMPSTESRPAETKPPGKPKVSLFSVTPQEDAIPTETAAKGDYQPLLYGADEGSNTQVANEAFGDSSIPQPAARHFPASGSATGPQNLTNIASELNLTEAERRQLFGRKGQGPDMSAANILEFNTDAEYAHNERLRQQGETVQHHALKSISGTGKNSLRSLINVATTQKEALEEHFAAGRRNKKEAGNKYGW